MTDRTTSTQSTSRPTQPRSATTKSQNHHWLPLTILLNALAFSILQFSYVVDESQHPLSGPFLSKENFVLDRSGSSSSSSSSSSKGSAGGDVVSTIDVKKRNDYENDHRTVTTAQSEITTTTTRTNQPTTKEEKKEVPKGDSQQQQQRHPDYHMVFSTSCDPQQDWESFVFFYHAYKVQQPGNVTRIASGCNERQSQDLIKFHHDYIKPMSSNFHLHLTNDFSRIHATLDPTHPHKGPYKYNNKPFGLRHWMEHGSLGKTVNQTSSSEIDDGIVFLLDPDMILLRPLVHNFTMEKVIWVEEVYNKNGEKNEKVPDSRKVVRHGNPIAQQDGYLTNQWMHLPMENFKKPLDREGPLHYNSGPPYLATVKDMYGMVVLWTDLAPKVLKIHDKLFAEMFGLVFATVQLKLPFTFIKSLVVSVTTTPNREGWDYVDQLPDDQVCRPDRSAPLPIGLHYCERYMLGKFFFSKYRVKKNIMRCDKALLEVPPPDLYPAYNYSIETPKADLVDKETYRERRRDVRARQAKREAFMLCHLTGAMNEALRYYKKAACKDGANLNETHSVYTDPSSW